LRADERGVKKKENFHTFLLGAQTRIWSLEFQNIFFSAEAECLRAEWKRRKIFILFCLARKQGFGVYNFKN
jgi:hypothetical protein